MMHKRVGHLIAVKPVRDRLTAGRLWNLPCFSEWESVGKLAFATDIFRDTFSSPRPLKN